jgi:DNA-3-methyladenine glycosylase I
MSAMIPAHDSAARERRCPWATDPLLAEYHDFERGRFPATEAGLFEALSLDVLQRGRAWREVLVRREDFRRAFSGFDPQRVAEVDEAGVARISQHLGLHGHDGRVRAVAQNARRLISARAEWGRGRDDVSAFGTWLRSTPSAGIIAELAERFRCVTVGSARNFLEAIGCVPLGHAPECWRARGIIFSLDGVVRLRAGGATPIDGAVPAIRAMATLHPLAAAGPGSLTAIRAALTERGLDGAFEVVVSADEVPGRDSGSDLYLLAASRLALRPADCLVVAANEDGVIAAHAAGTAVTRVRNGAGDLSSGAVLVDRIADIDADAIIAQHAPRAQRRQPD